MTEIGLKCRLKRPKKAKTKAKWTKIGQSRAQMDQIDRNGTKIWLKTVQKGPKMVKTRAKWAKQGLKRPK